MNCSEVQERLSSFYDNQLSQGEAALVAAHVTNCSSCAAELASFEQLSGLSRQLTDPPVPDYIWQELQSKLDVSALPKTALRRTQHSPYPGRLLTLAATVLVAIGMGAVAYQTWFSPGDDHLAVDFSQYLENFVERSDDAQQILLAKYDGRPITLTQATNILGYEPVASQGLPSGYSLEKIHLLKMPCCTCAQITCKNEAGESVAIFEHAIDQPVWFGDRPTVEYLCHGMPTCVRQVGDCLAATWRVGKRYITIIGATDIDEVTEFVAHFKELNAGKS